MEARLTINLAKSEFSASTVMYLGLLVGHGGIRPREKEVADILSHEAPRYKKALRTSHALIGLSPFLPPELWSCEPPLRTCRVREGPGSGHPPAKRRSSLKALLASTPVLQAPNFE